MINLTNNNQLFYNNNNNINYNNNPDNIKELYQFHDSNQNNNDNTNSSNIPLNRFHRNATFSSSSSSLNSNLITSSLSALYLLPTTTTTISSVIRTTANSAVSSSSSNRSIDWVLRQLVDSSDGGANIDSSTSSISFINTSTPLQPPQTLSLDITDGAVLQLTNIGDQSVNVFAGSDSDVSNANPWSYANNISILIGAGAG